MRTFNTGETEESLREQYNPDGAPLRRGQLVMLDMLKYIDELCRKNGIEYRLDSGNVLGAVRHGGFIPWDDDVDIALFRKDYFKLYRVLKREQHSRFALQDGKTDKKYYLYFIKLRDKFSHHKSADNSRDKLTYDGFQIDIFPMIKGPITFLIRIDCFIYHIENKIRLRNGFFWRMFHWTISTFIHPVFRFCSILFGDKSKVGYDYGVHAFEQVSLNCCYPYKPIQYEDIVLMGPAAPVRYCQEMYGDGYDQLPPIEKRNHHNVDKYEFVL